MLVHRKKKADVFAVGDLVFLNSGGPEMRVEGFDGDEFPPICLTPIGQGVKQKNGHYEPVSYH